MTTAKKLFAWAQPLVLSPLGLLVGFGLVSLCLEAAEADFLRLGLVVPAVLMLVPLQILEQHREVPQALVARMLAAELWAWHYCSFLWNKDA